MTRRQRLPNRRQSETLDFEHGGHFFTVSSSRFDDGRIAEIFISSNRPGSPIESIERDGAITASLLFQFGCPIGVLRSALTKDHDGSLATLLGRALGAIEAAR